MPLRIVRLNETELPTHAELARAGAWDAERAVNKAGGRREYALRPIPASVAAVARRLDDRALVFASVVDASATDEEHQTFHADDAVDASAGRAIVYLDDVVDASGGALEVRGHGAVLGPRGTAAVYAGADVHRGRRVDAGRPSRAALALAFSNASSRVRSIGNVLTLAGSSISAWSYAVALAGGVMSAFDASTYQLVFSGDCGAFIGEGGTSITVSNGDGLSYAGGDPNYTKAYFIIGRVWPTGLATVNLDATPWASSNIDVALHFLTDAATEAEVANWFFVGGEPAYSSVSFVRSNGGTGPDLQIIAYDLSNSPTVVYDSASDSSSLGGTWFASGGGGLCLEGAAMLTLADGSPKAARDVQCGDVLRAVDVCALSRGASVAEATTASRVLIRNAEPMRVGGRVRPWTIPKGVRGATRDTVLASAHGVVTAGDTADAPPLTPASKVAGTREATPEEAARVQANGIMTFYNFQMEKDEHCIVANGVLVEGLRGKARGARNGAPQH